MNSSQKSWETSNPICRKCNKPMWNALGIMMGIEYKCIECEEVITCQQWRLRKNK